MSRKEKIDFYLGKLMSRKLTAFVIGSVGLFTGQVSDDNWVILGTAYISIEGFTNIVERLKTNGQ